MIGEKYKWLYPYTMACTGGNLAVFQGIVESEKFQDFFRGNFSREKVRDYFMGPHNAETLSRLSHPEFTAFRYFHLAIPYEIESIGDGVTGKIFKPFYENLPSPLLKIKLNNKRFELVRELGLLERELRTGEILISHASFIAEICEKKDMAKYESFYKKVAA